MSTVEKREVRDLSDLQADGKDDAPLDPVAEKTATLVRRVGLLFFGGLGFAIFLPILIGVGRGIAQDRVWDPDSGLPAVKTWAGDSCVSEARRLMLDAPRHTKLVRVWAEPYREWQTRCKNEHAELYKILRDTREELRRKELSPAPAAAPAAPKAP